MAIDQVDEYGNDLSAPGYAPPFVQARDEARSKMAQQRAMKWRQRASALAAGLASAGGASNFGEGLLRGLSGSLAGAEKFSTGQEERDAVRAQGEAQAAFRKAQLLEQHRHNVAMEPNANQRSVPRDVGADELARLNARLRFLNENPGARDLVPGVSPPGQPNRTISFGDWLKMTPEQRKQYGEFRGVGRTINDTEDLGSITDVLSTDEFGIPRTVLRRKIKSNTPGLSYDRTTGQMNVPGQSSPDPLQIRRK